MKYLKLFTIIIMCHQISAQQHSSLDTIILNSDRINVPFKESSRSMTILTSKEIEASPANNLADLLQQVAGVDIRRRGLAGMQADLYIRGGSFDQTLLLIDGIKVEDAQTGHHTLNLGLPLEVIERIEIVKGPAARVYGQNAFTGAINIVTKKINENSTRAELQTGSFSQRNVNIRSSHAFEKSSVLFFASRNTSEGYRHNTDFDNQNYFFKSRHETSLAPIDILASFQERKFGANGFYASPTATEQYEETQASLIGISSKFVKEKITVNPRVYWRRNQDEYIFVRQDPSIYRNLHISNKVGAEINASYSSKIGTTGFGIDAANVFLSSNNLGDRERFMITTFLEHRFRLFNNALDITPGVAVNYFSDFKFHAFPGVDIGYRFTSNLKAYTNVGYTYRIPTYTDLFYSDPTTIGNEDLNPEEAFAQEIGFKYSKKTFSFSMAIFNRDAKKLIDYVKDQEADLWQATNIRKLNTTGFEASGSYHFKTGSFSQQLHLDYTFIEDNIKVTNINFSRYSINSLRHNFVIAWTSHLGKILSPAITYRYAKRADGQAYSLFDAGLNANFNSVKISIMAYNIFNKAYTETNLVPMPKGHVLFGVAYTFK